MARFYDSALGRFISADRVVPDGVQGYDRYAYANNNPVLYNDPSGHCVPGISILCGAAIGALAGGAIYAVTTLASGREFRGSDFGAAVAVGAVGGALIGSGIGAGAGIAAFAAVGAGTGVLGSQLGYSIASGANYDTGEMVIAAAVGGATGALTGGVNGSSLAGTVTAYAIDVAANGAANTVQYAATQLYNGETIDPSTAALSAAEGAAAAALINLPGQLFSPRYSPHDAQYWNMVQQGRFIRPDVLFTARSIVRQRLVGGTLTAVVRNTVEYGLAQAQ